MAVAYAAWDFGGRAGHRDLSGVVLIDGGLLGAFTSPRLAGVKQRLDALRSGDPFLDLLGLHVPWASGVVGALGGLYVRVLPTARARLNDFTLLPAALRAPFPVTNEGALGYAFDRTTSPAALALIHVRARAPGGRGRPAAVAGRRGHADPERRAHLRALAGGRGRVVLPDPAVARRRRGQHARPQRGHQAARPAGLASPHDPAAALRVPDRAHPRAGAARRAAARGVVADPGAARAARRRHG